MCVVEAPGTTRVVTGTRQIETNCIAVTPKKLLLRLRRWPLLAALSALERAQMAAVFHVLKKRREAKKKDLPDVNMSVYKVFKKLDDDNSGHIEADEMVAALEMLDRTVTEKQAGRLIAECGPLVNRNKGLVDEDGSCESLDIYGFAKIKSIIDIFKPAEPFLDHSIISDLGIVPKTSDGKGRPLPYQAEVRHYYTNPIVVWTVASVILGNFVVNILEKEYDPDQNNLQMAHLWDAFDTAFNAIFLVELVWNMYGFGFGVRFWRVGWNVFDFFITAVGVVLMAGVSGPISQLKLLRAFRVFRLFKRIKSLNKIIMSLLSCIPGVVNVFVILFIFFCIYAILAVELFRDFGQGECRPEPDGSYAVPEFLIRTSASRADPDNFTGELIDYSLTSPHTCYMTDDLGSLTHVVDSRSPRGYVHGIEYYGTYSRAMYTLFQLMTGDSWAECLARPLIFGLFQRSAITTGIFFISFVILTNMVMMNVVVAVLLDQFVAPPPSGLTDGEVKEMIRFIKQEMEREQEAAQSGKSRFEIEQELSRHESGELSGSADPDRIAKLVTRLQTSLERNERNEQAIQRLESKLDLLLGSSSAALRSKMLSQLAEMSA